MPADPSPTRSEPPAALPHGLILAGGEGRRMGGAHKALLPLAGRPLLVHVMARIAPQVCDLAVNANEVPPELEALVPVGAAILGDSLPGRPGPLAGVLAGLDHLAAQGLAGPLLTVPTDTPFLPGDLAERLCARQQECGTVVCAGSSNRRHPVIALWPQGAREVIRSSLARDERKVGLLLEALGAVTEFWNVEAGDPFFNVNTPADLKLAETHLLPVCAAWSCLRQE